jgi:hypothetical protein
MSSLWDAVFVQVLNSTGPLMLNLSRHPISNLNQILGKDDAKRKELDKVDLFTEKLHLDPEYRDLCDFQPGKASVSLKILTWKRISFVQKTLYRIATENVLLLISIASSEARIERCLSRHKPRVGHQRN